MSRLSNFRYNLRAILSMIAVVVLLMGTTHWLDGHHLLETQTPMGEEDTELGSLMDRATEAFAQLALAVLALLLIKSAILPGVRFDDVILGRGQFEKSGEDLPRAAIIIALALILCAIIGAMARSF